MGKLLISILILFFGLYVGKTEITNKTVTMQRPLMAVIFILTCLCVYYNL
jgi:hypothetical protein